MPNEAWFTCLPECETAVPCGQGQHAVRWEAGSLRLPLHPDAEAELVLAALGGDKARCIDVAQAWERHVDDLSVLAIGPRGPADRIAVGWADVDAALLGGPTGQAIGPVRGLKLTQTGPIRPGTMRAGTPMPGTGQPFAGKLASPPPPGAMASPPPPGAMASPPPPGAMARASARRRQLQEERDQVRLRRGDMLSLLALGYGFQVRLIGQVAAAYAARDPVGARPALVAAIAGRLAPVAERWLGIDPDQVVVTLHEGPGWGSVELTGPHQTRQGQDRRLRVSLPTGWLASVWACGLAMVGRHLVVAVEEPGFPTARVLGLRSPAAEPEPLDVHADPDGPADVPHWEI